MDAENYTQLPISQYEEDNILRELNKCLLAFQQNKPRNNNEMVGQAPCFRQRRLSPIGESVSSSIDPPESSIPLITQQSCSTNKSRSPDNNSGIQDRLKVNLNVEKPFERKGQIHTEGMFNNRRGRFIVLGSSGECLPVKRKSSCESPPSSCSSSEEYHSAKASLEGKST